MGNSNLLKTLHQPIPENVFLNDLAPIQISNFENDDLDLIHSLYRFPQTQGKSPTAIIDNEAMKFIELKVPTSLSLENLKSVRISKYSYQIRGGEALFETLQSYADKHAKRLKVSEEVNPVFYLMNTPEVPGDVWTDYVYTLD